MNSRQRFSRMVGALACLMVTLATYGQGASPLEDRMQTADVVAFARCENVTTEWRGGKVFSRARYKVLSPIKGNTNEELVVSVLGGTAEHPSLQVPVTTEASHGLTVRPGEEAIIYVSRRTGRSGVDEHHLFAKDAAIVASDGTQRVLTRRRVTKKDVTAPARAGEPPTVMIRHERPTVQEYIELLQNEVNKQ